MGEVDELFNEIFGSEEKKEEKPKEEEPKQPIVEEKPKQEEAKPIVQEVKSESESEPIVKVEEPTKKDIPFEIREETGANPKTVWIIFGDKGSGKTTTALSFPGTIAVLSFDRKTAIIKATRYNNDPRIHVFDVTKYMIYKDQKTITESAARTYDYIMAVLDYVEMNIHPDWIVIDGAEIMQQVCEWTMRFNNDIEAFAGIANLNLWKERRMLIRAIHNKALNIAHKGLIYTTYVTYDEIVVNGELVTRKDVPKWIDVLVYETDFVIKTEQDIMNKKFYVIVSSSKDDNLIKTGSKLDVTGRKLWDVVKEVRS